MTSRGETTAGVDAETAWRTKWHAKLERDAEQRRIRHERWQETKRHNEVEAEKRRLLALGADPEWLDRVTP